MRRRFRWVDVEHLALLRVRTESTKTDALPVADCYCRKNNLFGDKLDG